MNDAATSTIALQPQPTWSDEERARAEHYALIARLLHAAPDAALLAALAQAGRTLGGELGGLPRAWAALGAAAGSMPLQAVADEFDALFVSVGKPEVMSNGSWYLTGFLQEEPLAELRDDLVDVIAEHAFAGKYDQTEIRHWLRSFLNRFFSQQFKRSVMPDGPKVGSLALSPRGDWRMPSDAEATAWLAELG